MRFSFDHLWWNEDEPAWHDECVACLKGTQRSWQGGGR